MFVVNIIQAVLYEAMKMFLFPSGERSKELFFKKFCWNFPFQNFPRCKGQKYIVYSRYKNCHKIVEVRIDLLA